jgi:gamma-glutamylcyclotransferase (GGCT)/AIG2-like uncharacterized protein YtfP
MITKNNQYVFVYGTLREGGKNHNKIHDCKKIGIGSTKDLYSFIGTMSGSFPYATKTSFDGIDKVNITGELYEVLETNCLHNLDNFEYNYSKEIVPVIVGGKTYQTNMYFLVNSDLIEGIAPNIYPNGRKRFYAIKSGDWFEEKKP